MKAVNIADLRELARRRLPRLVWEYLEGGAEDGITARANRECFENLRFAPRVLVDTSQRSLATTLLGRSYDAPFGIAPMGAAGLVWPDADIALAQAARSANVPHTLSTHAFATPDAVARASGGPSWFQLYMSPQRQRVRELLARAKHAGCDTLLLTADVPVGGNREYRHGFGLPLRPGWRQFADGLAHPRWLAQVLFSGGLYRRAAQHSPGSWGERRDALDWRDFLWLRNSWRGKLLLKGVLSPQDALTAADLGADGIVVSNHGGRQLDGAPSPLEVLPAIAAAVKGKLAIVADSGFCRGSDIVKALCLGADFVLVGRAALYGAAVAGEPGVRLALRLLQEEVGRVMALIGCRSVAQLGGEWLLNPAAAPPAGRPLPGRELHAISEPLPAGVLPLRRRDAPIAPVRGPLRPPDTTPAP